MKDNAPLDPHDIRKGLAAKAAKGAVALAIGRPLTIVANIGATLILARLLAPTDYGLVGMVVVFLRFADVFKDMGLGTVTVQRENLDEGQLSSLFWINTAVALCIALLFAACAPLMVTFYDEPKLKNLTYFAAVAFAFGGCSVQHMALLKRQMRLTALVAVQLTALGVALASAVALAWYGAGPYALVARVMIESVVLFIGYRLLSGFRPGRPRGLSKLRAELKFGFNLTISNLVNYLSRQGDNLIVGKLFGAAPLGLYQKSYELMMMPLTHVTRPLASIAIPALSRLAQDSTRYCAAYFRMTDKALLLSTPVAALLCGAPASVIEVLLGSKWLGAVPMLQGLSLVVFIQPLSSTTGWLLTTQDRTGEMLRLSVITAVMNVLSFAVGAIWGPVGVAWAYGLGQVVRVPTGFWYVCRRGPIRQRQLYSALGTFCAAGGVGAAGSYWAARAVDQLHPLVALVAAGSAAVGVTWGFLWLLPRGRSAMLDVRKALLLAR